MPEIDEPMEMDVHHTSDSSSAIVIIAVFIFMMVILAVLMLFMNSQDGKDWRLAGMREACAAGRAEPLNCVDEGVPMEWAVKGETK